MWGDTVAAEQEASTAAAPSRWARWCPGGWHQIHVATCGRPGGCVGGQSWCKHREKGLIRWGNPALHCTAQGFECSGYPAVVYRQSFCTGVSVRLGIHASSDACQGSCPRRRVVGRRRAGRARGAIVSSSQWSSHARDAFLVMGGTVLTPPTKNNVVLRVP